MRKEDSNLAEEIKDMVERSIQQMDFSDLSKKINTTVNSAMSEAKSAIMQGSDSIKRQMESNGFFREKKAEIVIPYKEKGKVGSVFSAILGGIGLFGFGIAMLVFLILTIVLPGIVVFPILLVAFSPLLLGSVLLFRKGINMNHLIKRSNRYYLILKEKGYCSIDSLANRMGMPVKKVKADIKKMLVKGIFPQGAMDEQETCFIGNNEYYEQYQLALNSYKERVEGQETEMQKETDMASQTNNNSEVVRVLQEGKNYLDEIQKIQNSIREIEFSRKLQRLHVLVEQIFEHIEKYPNQLEEIRRFMDYYLPTTLKLVKAYENISAQPIQGENMLQSKKEIEDTIDTINKAFLQLLDSLYEDVTMDVSTDISVLNTMLAREGLMENNFKGQM